MKLVFILFLLVLVWRPSAPRTKQPNPHARDVFASVLFRTLLHQLQRHPHPVVVISPASVQKMLAVFYNISSHEYMRPLARDIGLHDVSTILRESIEHIEAKTRARLLRERKDRHASSITAQFLPPYQVLDYFAKDFDELGSDIAAQNYFVFNGDYEIADSFQRSARDYFNITVLPKHQSMVTGLLNDFGLAKRGLEIYSFVKFHAYLGKQFHTSQGFTYGSGSFRFANNLQVGLQGLLRCKVLELPLYSTHSKATSLLLIMPHKHVSMALVESKLLAQSMRSFKLISKQLQVSKVAVRLPTLKFLSKINLGAYIKQMPWLRLHHIFNLELQYRGMFDKEFNRRIQVERFMQSTNMQLHVPGGQAPLSKQINPLRFFNNSETFDCSSRPFLFIIKSADVIYFMGEKRRVPSKMQYTQY